MNRFLKLLSAIIVFMLLVFVIQNFSMADYNFKEKIDSYANSDGASEINDKALEISGTVITVTQLIATGVAIVMLLVLAMKYMISSAGDRAEIKKHAVVYIVGAIILFSASGILEIIERMAEGF